MPHDDDEFELVLKGISPDYAKALGKLVTCHAHPEGLLALSDAQRAKAVALITTGFAGATAAEMDALPSLQIVCASGTGYEGVDLAAAQARGLAVSHAAGVNAGVVADHVMGLLIGVVRRIPQLHAYAQAGGWRDAIVPYPVVHGRKLGIFGMGGIGQATARRAAGFDIEVSYCSRSHKPELPYRFVPDLLTLAREVDYLACVAPGGPETFHIVNAEIFKALGPKGYFVNAGRGSIVDTAALIAALEGNVIAGAGLDVFETEPNIPDVLRTHPNVVITPHVAGVAVETQSKSIALLLTNIRGFLSTRRLVTPIPGYAQPVPQPVFS